MNNVPIIGKILAIVTILAAVTLLATIYSTGKIREIRDGYTAAIDHEGSVALYGARANRALMFSRASIANLLIASDDGQNKDALAKLDSAKAGFIKFMHMASDADVTGHLHVVDLLNRSMSIIEADCKKAIELGSVSNDTASVLTSQAEYLKNCNPAFEDMTQAILKFVDQAVVEQNAVKADLAAMSESTIVTTYVAIFGGLAAVLIASFFAVRAWISYPLKGLTDTMTQLAGGDLDVVIEGAKRRDEIGSMARAVEIFQGNGHRLQASESQSAHARQEVEAERARNAAAHAEAAQQQAQVVESLASGLARLSTGELAFRIDRRFAAEYEALRSDFNSAMEKLQDTMRTVAVNASTIRSGTSEISTASDDLSRRTEQQAASLEETAAALDEITATVRRTAEGAKHVRTVVGDAKVAAEQSGRVVQEAVEAMSGIERSSREIGQIIGVIDEIAFQTNLLALNAGVEAARAGDAGRGFAVVASEVRALAQRSAEAAKEIKALISTSGTQVGQGVDLVAKTGQALARIVMQVAEIDGIVGEISASAQEQATALDQVNAAVNQMDQVTQQNAAMVEESTAASQSLAQETIKLARLIGQFKIGESAVDPVRDVSARAARPAPVVPHAARALRTVGRGGAARVPLTAIAEG